MSVPYSPKTGPDEPSAPPAGRAGASGRVILHRRSDPQRLRYVARKLTEGKWDPARAAFVLEMIATEQELTEDALKQACPVCSAPPGQDCQGFGIHDARLETERG